MSRLQYHISWAFQIDVNSFFGDDESDGGGDGDGDGGGGGGDGDCVDGDGGGGGPKTARHPSKHEAKRAGSVSVHCDS